MDKPFFFLVLLTFMCISCHQEQTVPVEIDFSWSTTSENHTSPFIVSLTNHTRNADCYEWTFEGGEPATSDKKNPGTVSFSTPGEHKITLEAWNLTDRKNLTSIIQVDSTVVLDFRMEVETNNYAPAQFHITNLSSGGNVYRWFFEGGEPSNYEGFNPPAITYSQEGNYTVILMTNNGSEDFVRSHNIEVRETLDASFTIIPSFEDIDDMEAPLRATFETRLQGVESLLWECENAVITDETSPEANILFNKEGNYTVYLTVSNGKQEQQISHEITVKPNTNLRTHQDIRFGINTAQESIGSVYSTLLRRSFKNTEIHESNGVFIDIAFLGLNVNFIYNQFISPDSLFNTPLRPIPEATTTKFINLQEKMDFAQLTVEQFKAMTTDTYLKGLDLSLKKPENDFFSTSPLPRIVLFETADGRKGAIFVKEIVKNGMENSYILTDIKIQKND